MNDDRRRVVVVVAVERDILESASDLDNLCGTWSIVLQLPSLETLLLMMIAAHLC